MTEAAMSKMGIIGIETVELDWHAPSPIFQFPSCKLTETPWSVTMVLDGVQNNGGERTDSTSVNFFESAYDTEVDTEQEDGVPRNFDQRPATPTRDAPTGTQPPTDTSNPNFFPAAYNTVPVQRDTPTGTGGRPTGTPAATELPNFFPPPYNTVPGSDGQPNFFPPPYNTVPGSDGQPNFFPPEQNTVPGGRRPDLGEDPYNPEWNRVGPDGTPRPEGQFRGTPRNFSENGETGRLYVDQATGYVTGIEFSSGARSGHRYSFDRSDTGQVTAMRFDVPGENGQRAVSQVTRNAQGAWTGNPPDRLPPGFQIGVPQNGIIPGDFSVNDKGDIKWESPDKNRKEIVRINGDRQVFDYRDYSRTTTRLSDRTPGGARQVVENWDGYEWRTGGQRTETAPGVYQIAFQPQQGKPNLVIRNSNTNGFEVDFGQGRTQFRVENWNHGRITRNHGGREEQLYNTGARGNDGRVQWVPGTEQTPGTVDFRSHRENAQRIQSGEIPHTVQINRNDGTVAGAYANGTQVLSDGSGEQQRIAYNGGQTVEMLRDANNQFRGVRRSDGTTIIQVRGAVGNPGADAAQPASTAVQWRVTRPGQEPLTVVGEFRQGAAGAFEVRGANNEGLVVTADGALMARAQGRTIQDTNVPPPGPRPDQPVPRPDQQVPPRPTDQAGLMTDAQLQGLATRYNVSVEFLGQARQNAVANEAGGSFTEQNVATFLEIAQRHQYTQHFTADPNADVFAQPGAAVGALMPVFLVQPDGALDAIAAGLRREIQASGRPQAEIDQALASIDQRFATLKTSTTAFSSELAAAMRR